MQRAPLHPSLAAIQAYLPEVLPILEFAPGHYGSISVERKAARSLWANLKQTQMSDQASLGAVVRVYDGLTLFEQATDEVSETGLKEAARAVALRVKASTGMRNSRSGSLRTYSAPSWRHRLERKLDSEILDQIPAGVSAKTPVHFGVRFKVDPIVESPGAIFLKLGGLVTKCKELASEAGVDDLSYVLARLSLSEEGSLFFDRESNLSQTLYRVALTLITMSGSDRTYFRTGGLGGLEISELADGGRQEILGLLKDLKALKTAERLNPGKYRVVFGPVLTGVLAHEAFGHSQEGDTCARGRSKAWELHHTGASVGNAHATILNNPAIYENGEHSYAAWGSYFFDEEGWLAEEQTLLDQGVLRAPMTNLTSALRLGIARTANGKRESWANGVYTRQTNTYFSPGKRTLSELLTSLGDGFIALHSAGGMEDPKGMGIQVGISYLEEVKAGKLTGRVFKGPAGGDIQMTGYTPDVLNSILDKSKIEAESSAVDHARHPFNDAGGCGKYHKEFVYAGCGGPYLLLKDVILG